MSDQAHDGSSVPGGRGAMPPGERHLPWMTEPSDLGFNRCGWCDRVIYLPALPCSIAPVEGLLRVATVPGQGERCKWEMTTRNPHLAEVPDDPRLHG